MSQLLNVRVDIVQSAQLLFVPPVISELTKLTNMRGTRFTVVSIIKVIAGLETLDSGLIDARVN